MSGARNQLSIVCALVAGLGFGCGAAPDTSEPIGTTQEEAKIELTPQALSFKYLELSPPLPGGVAAGEKVVFIGDPLAGRVVEYSRQSGRQLGELPQPPNPFVLPFMMKHIAPNKVAIMDAGGFPTPLPLVPANPTIYEYTYTTHGNTVNATLTRSIPFSSALIGFAEDIVLLKDGRYLLADAVLGGIWIANTDGTITPGIVPKTIAAADAIPQLYFCPTMPLVHVGGVPFLFTGSTIPGISTITERDGMVYFASACAGAVYKVPLASLTDSRQPWQRAADIQLLSPKPQDAQVEELLSMTFDPSNPHEHYMYAADAMRLRLIRINTITGARQIVGDDPELFNFPSSLSFMPPVTREEIFPQLVVVSNQQQLTPILNDAVTEDMFQFPFLATRVVLKPRLH
jgi:hypothetical protein